MTKQIKIIIAVALGVVGLGVALFIAQPEQAETNGHDGMDQGQGQNQSVLEADKTLYDFGTISMKNGKVTNVFTIKNPTSEPVKLTKLFTSCMCTEAVLKIGDVAEGPFGMQGHGRLKTFRHTLEAGAEVKIEVTFDPNAHGPAGVGVIERTVTLEGDNGKLVSVNIKANVTP